MATLGAVGPEATSPHPHMDERRQEAQDRPSPFMSRKPNQKRDAAGQRGYVHWRPLPLPREARPEAIPGTGGYTDTPVEERSTPGLRTSEHPEDISGRIRSGLVSMS